MEARDLSKWRQEVEEILRQKYRVNEFQAHLESAFKLIELTQEVEKPSGEIGEVAAMLLRMASEEQRPLAAVYAGFQLGVAYERYQNANRA
jgi:hypothetical protein